MDIASRRCAQCHLVDGGRTRSAAPPLPVIARDVSWTDDRLADFLTTGMRGLSISRQEIDNLVAYIRSLEPHFFWRDRHRFKVYYYDRLAESCCAHGQLHSGQDLC